MQLKIKIGAKTSSKSEVNMFIFIVIIASVEVAHIVCHRTFKKK